MDPFDRLAGPVVLASLGIVANAAYQAARAMAGLAPTWDAFYATNAACVLVAVGLVVLARPR